MAAEDQEFVVVDENDTKDFNPEGVLPLSDDNLSRIRQWLAPTDYAAPSSEWRKHCTSHLAGTGSWIADTEQYRQWHDKDRGGLWIKAVAGVGKSVAAATIVSNLASTEKVPVLYFFFRHIVTANQTPKSLVRDFLAQVLLYSPRLQKNIFKFVDEERRPLESVSLNELWDLLVSALIQLPRVYCIIDALDEMDVESEDFLDMIVALAEKQPSSIKVLLTSRPIPLVERHFRNTDILQLPLHPHLVNPDISVYVRHRVNEHEMSSQLRSHIHDTMYRKAEGHFLYARLMLDDLFDGTKNAISDDTKIYKTLDELPTPMADMYSQMLLDHSRKSRSPQMLQVAILQWVTGAERPLRLLELSALVDIKQLMPQANKDAKSIIREACGPLLEIFEDETVHPIHHSFTEFLYDQSRHDTVSNAPKFPVLNHKTAQSFLAITCVEYLASDWYAGCLLASSTSESDEPAGRRFGDRNALKFKHPWLDYVAKNWSCHVRKSRSEDESLMTALSRIFEKDSDTLYAWLIWDHVEPQFGRTDENLDTWSPLHAAAHKGVACFVERLLQCGCDINQLTSSDRTPLLLAARSGYQEVVQVLLKHGAKNDEPDSHGLKPLHHAARGNAAEDVVKLLLDAGVDPYTGKTRENPGRRCGNSRSTIGESPVQYACAAGNLGTMKVFIPFLKGENLQQALYWALVSGNAEIVKEILLRPEIDVNYYFRNSTPLYLASRMRDVSIMRLLIDMGADAKLLSNNYNHYRSIMQGNNTRHASPLHAFAGSDLYGSRSLRNLTTTTMMKGFALLLEAGADANATNASGSTILHDILRLGSQYHTTRVNGECDIALVLEMLFKKGLAANVLTNDGSNALHLASRVEPDVLDTLLHHGIKINEVRGSDGKTPLMAVVGRGDLVTARHLLQKGAGVNIADKDGNTVLHLIGKSFFSAVDLNFVRDIIAAGADINSKNHDGDTALHIGQFKLDLTGLFVQHGFDLESKNKLGQTLLFQSVSPQCSGESYKRLMELGSDPLARDAQGGSILHSLVRARIANPNGTIDMIRYFVDSGVDPRACDVQGNNILHTIASIEGRYYNEKEQRALMQSILDYQVSITAKNLAGQTPLHIAFTVGRGYYNYRPIDFLLERTDVDIDIADYDLIRPLHLAVCHDSRSTCLLLERGADCTAQTKEEQTPLMIACRTRQCDTVCILLDHYRKSHLLHLIDQADRTGQTALHYACRSGRPETVALLLEAGADVHAKDKQGATPLHACAYVLEEAAVWSEASNSIGKLSKASYVLSANFVRSTPPWSVPSSDRVRESIRLLIEYGADISFLSSGDPHDFKNPLATAITKGCVPMVSELCLIKTQLLHNAHIRKSEIKIRRHNEADTEMIYAEAQDMVRHRMRTLQQKLQFSKLLYTPDAVAASVETGKPNTHLVDTLLEYDDEPGVRQLVRLGARFDLLDHNGDHVSSHLASKGYADLLRDLIDCTGHVTVANMKDVEPQAMDRRKLKSILLTALERSTPNLSVVRVIVSELHHNVNEMWETEYHQRITQTYVHKLAVPSYWWQTQALSYLLDNGASVDITNSDGETALVLAIRSLHNSQFSPAQFRAVEVLLEHGANPNAIDKDGLTCLNIAARQPRCIEALLKYGADPLGGARSFLLDAIAAQDIETIRRIVASGADLNQRSNLTIKSDSKLKCRSPSSRQPTNSSCTTAEVLKDPQSIEELVECGYPIHVAASKFFNLPDKQSLAQEIIQLLLNGKANPWLTYEDGSTILHYLIRSRGILDLFFSQQSFDTELRDGQGCTFLHVACGSWDGQSVDGKLVLESHSTIKMLLDRGASITAVDNEGRNALHHLVNAVANLKLGIDVAECHKILQPFFSSSISKGDAKGRTPYHYAVVRHHIELVHILLANASDFSTPDPVDGTTALHHLAPQLVANVGWYFGRTGELKRRRGPFTMRSGPILFKSQQQNTIRKDEMTAEEFAEAKQHLPHPLFTSLIERGLDINHRDADGETPLLKLAGKGAGMACWYTDEEETGTSESVLLRAFRIMQGAGADLKVRNHMGESALHKLAKANLVFRSNDPDWKEGRPPHSGLTETFKWMVDQGLDVAWEDREQRTCLDLAAASGAWWLTKLFERSN